MKNKCPLISVVMLNYNGLNYLKKTIKPILNLEYHNYEFIIVDNGSTDGSIEYIKKFKKIKLIKSPRLREKNFACNYAIKRAKGKYILLLDNDALLNDIKIIKNLLNLYSNKIGAISLSFFDVGKLKSSNYGGYFNNYTYIKKNKAVQLKSLSDFNNCQVGFPQGFAIFISRNNWLKIGGYDDHLIFGGDDSDLGIKLWLYGYENILYSKTAQTHLGLPKNKTNVQYQLRLKETFYAHLYTIVKNYSFVNMLITLFFYSIFSFIKSVKQAIQRNHLPTFFAFFQGYYLFLINLPIAFKKRKEIQSKRVIKEDIFLKIRPLRLD
ncbi:MAG: Glycosyltransferase AglE [archaeon ADurb.Bin336]|nr:MAG: Glycosyltransferase AglE [archaeon ADurb.Bin336]